MTDTLDQTLLQQLQQISQAIGEVKQEVTELNGRNESVDQRLLMIERCLANLHSDLGQSRGRTIWSDEERKAFSNWLETNANIDEDFANFPS